MPKGFAGQDRRWPARVEGHALEAAPHLTSGPGSGRMRRRPDRLGCSSAPPPRHDHLSVRTLGPRKHDLRQWDGIESSQMLVLFRHNVLEQPRAFP